ncbi:hypothetical protein JRQ81_014014 [Phrynocephalus forsythii]|uniref:Receptor-type tyrosine-protein phosphatase V n=1 Tax=Phrynocephalus forsythii TaxID=171643 RepID=A0A9Q0XVX0_9SAUR|nr:hypothetical protein JRQ81_014014 [Phrynocephalus forsythii]
MVGVAGPYQSLARIVSGWTYPLVPPGLTLASSRWSSSLVASWSLPSGDRDQFFLRFYSQEHQPLQRNITIGPGTQNFTFEDLLPGTQYFLEVTTLAGPYRASSQVVSAWTREHSRAFIFPQQLLVSWVKSGLGRETWLQLYSDESLTAVRNVSVPHGVTQVTLDGLIPGTRYRVEIVSRAGPHSISSQTAIGYTVPLMPVSLLVNRHGTSMLTAQWKAPAGQRDSYMVSVSEEGMPDTRNHMAVGKASTNVTLTGLTPGTCYFVAVWSLAGPYSSVSRNGTACTAPAAPVNLTLKNTGNSSLLYTTWEEPPGGRNHYRMVLYSLVPPGMEQVHVVRPSSQDFLWTDLPAGSQFAVQVIAVKSQAEASSTIAIAWTPPLPATSVQTQREKYPDKLSIAWARASGRLDSYELNLYHPASNSTVVQTTLGKDATNFTFSGLTPGATYVYEIISRAGPCSTSAGKFSAWTHPLVPGKLSIKPEKGSPAASVTWAKPLSKPEHCQLQLLYPRNNTMLQHHVLTPWQIRHVFKGLVPGRNYSVSLSCTAGPYKSRSQMMTVAIEPSQVKDLQCLPDITSLFLNWTIPGGDIESYELAMEELPRGSPQAVSLLAVSRADITLAKLTSNTPYQISVRAIGKDGIRGPAVKVQCDTLEEVLPPPVRMDALQFDDSSRIVIFPDMFSEENGLIEYYGVVVTTNDSLLRPTQDIISHTWYDHYYGQEDSYLALLVPNPFHLNESTGPKAWPVTVGTEECNHSRNTCNGKLKTDAQYRFSIAAFTRYSQQAPRVSFTAFSAVGASAASATVSAPVVTGIIMGFLLTVTAIAGLIFWRHQKARRTEKGNVPQEMATYSLRNTHRPILLQNFRQYYEARAANSNQGFFQDFEELKEVGKEQPKAEGELSANSSKNRYPHVLPYDHSRVKLSLLDGDPHSDYINANFVPGYSSPQEFIATQGPLKKTLDDFWRLVWEQHVCTIVMLTVGMENGRVLCECYWPSDSSPVCSGQVSIHLLAQNFAEEWATREFKLQHEGLNMERRVVHLHYTAWPNHGVPESTASMIAFIELVRAHMQNANETGPTLVHGSAGVGRTGTFIALDRLLQQLKYEKVVDVFNAVYSLRRNRHRMIETLGQYIFLHNCILERLSEEPLLDLSGVEVSHPIPLKNFLQHHAKNCSNANAGFLREYEQMLLEAAKEDVSSAILPSDNQQISLDSSKSPCSFADHRSKVKFSPVDRDPFSDLPHVWFIPGCNSIKDYIAIEGPYKLAVEEFWALIWEHGVHTIITLQNSPTSDNSCWPSESEPVCTERVTVQKGPEKVVSGWQYVQLRLKYEKRAKERLLQRFRFPLGEGEDLPDPEILVGFLTTIRELVPYRKRTSPLVLHCSLGSVSHMGMLIALDSLLQQLKEEKSVDVYGVVLRLVKSCCLMTPTLDKYIYLYECICDIVTQKLV